MEMNEGMSEKSTTPSWFVSPSTNVDGTNSNAPISIDRIAENAVEPFSALVGLQWIATGIDGKRVVTRVDRGTISDNSNKSFGAATPRFLLCEGPDTEL